MSASLFLLTTKSEEGRRRRWQYEMNPGLASEETRAIVTSSIANLCSNKIRINKNNKFISLLSLSVSLLKGYHTVCRSLRHGRVRKSHCVRSHREECLDAHSNQLLSLQSRRIGPAVPHDG
jgi:hypothetical protein